MGSTAPSKAEWPLAERKRKGAGVIKDPTKRELEGNQVSGKRVGELNLRKKVQLKMRCGNKFQQDFRGTVPAAKCTSPLLADWISVHLL
jgi:hypothetical protein